MKKLMIIAALVAAALAAEATQYSKLAVITAAKAVGKWDGIKAWIAAAGYEDEWNACQYLSDDYPQFAAITNAVVQSGVASVEDIERIIYASRDTAVPDAMIAHVVSNECLTASGRVKWHGKVVATNIDTNALVCSIVYADGYVHNEPFRAARPPSLEQQLSAAGRRKLLAERAEARRQARIAELTTNMTANATALARRKGYPLDLATLILQHELNTLVTNEVTVIYGN